MSFSAFCMIFVIGMTVAFFFGYLLGWLKYKRELRALKKKSADLDKFIKFVGGDQCAKRS